MKKSLFRGKSRKTKIFSLITLIALVLVLSINFLFYAFALDKTIFLDMTPEGLYSLSDAMKKECDAVFDKLEEREGDEKIVITFCNDPDYLMSRQATRLSYVTALKLRNRYPDMIKLVEENVTLDPTSVSQYKTTSLSKINPDDIIISYGGKYRIVSADSMMAGEEYYNGEYRFASLIKSVAALSNPVAYFVCDHGETVYNPDEPESEMSIEMSAFADLLLERGMAIKVISLKDYERVPDDCALLIINNPTSDFTADGNLSSMSYVSETEKLDRYMTMKQGAIMVVTDPSTDWSKMKNFKNFLLEWGLEPSDTIVYDEESSIRELDASGAALPPTKVIAEYDRAEENFGYGIYGNFVELSSAPSVIFDKTGVVKCAYGAATSMNEPGSANTNRHYAPFLLTSDTAELIYVDPETGAELTDTEAGVAHHLASIAIRNELNEITGERKISYLFLANSESFLTDKVLGESSYANFDVISSLVNSISRIDEYASMDLGGESINSTSVGGKRITSTDMSESGKNIYSNKSIDPNAPIARKLIKYINGISTTEKVVFTICIALIPLAIGVVGIVVNVRRRHL